VSKKKEIVLGCEVTDIVTGFKGIVTGYHKWLTGCDTCTINPKVTKGGGKVDSECLDVNRLKYSGKGVSIETKSDEKPGGPQTTPVQSNRV
jgi:hypothetical protein